MTRRKTRKKFLTKAVGKGKQKTTIMRRDRDSIAPKAAHRVAKRGFTGFVYTQCSLRCFDIKSCRKFRLNECTDTRIGARVLHIYIYRWLRVPPIVLTEELFRLFAVHVFILPWKGTRSK